MSILIKINFFNRFLNIATYCHYIHIVVYFLLSEYVIMFYNYILLDVCMHVCNLICIYEAYNQDHVETF